MKNSGCDNDDLTVTAGVATPIANGKFKVVAGASNGVSFQSGSNYMHLNSSSLNVTSNQANADLNISAGTSANSFLVKRNNSGSLDRVLKWTGTNWTSSSTMSDACEVYFFKRTTSITYYVSDPNCCTELGSINGSFNRSNQKIDVTWTGATNVDICYSKNSTTKPNSPQVTNVTSCSIDVSSYSAGDKCYIWGRQNCGGGATSDWTAISNNYVTIPSHTLSITATNGSVALNPNSTTIVEGRTVELTATGNEGYAFSSWSLTSGTYAGLTSTSTNPTTFTMGTSDAAVTATFAIQSYTLTWELDGGSVKTEGTAAGSVTYGATLTAPIVEKTGYTFAGWSPSVAATMPAEATTYTATWTPNDDTPYSVEHYQQNIANDDYTLFETQNLTGTTAAQVTPAVKIYEGFTAPIAQKITILADGSLVVKYYYTRNSHTLTWVTDGDDLQGEYTNGTIKYGATITAPDTPTKTNYLFSGWHNGTSIVTPTTMPDEDVTYTAQWVADDKWGVTITAPEHGTITVSWADGEGDHSFTSGSQEIDKNAEITITAVAANGYSAPAKVVVNDGELNNGGQMTLTSSIVISATFSLQTYTITYNLDEGTNHGDNPVNYNITSSDISLEAPSKTGYTFLGWYNNSDLAEGHKVTGTAIASGSTGNKEFWAKWQINSHTLVWDLDDGSIQTAGTAAGSVNYGTALVAPTVTKTGYTFNGWSPSVDATMPDNDVTYIAQWNVKSYGVTWMISGTEWTDDGQSTVNYGSHVETLPTAPDPGDYCGDKFMGWTDAANGAYVHDTSNLYTTADDFPNATGAQTFYAVFADYTK